MHDGQAIEANDSAMRNLGWLAILGASVSIVICYLFKLTSLLPAFLPVGPISLNPHIQAALMCVFAFVAVAAIWRDRRAHGRLRPTAFAIAGFAIIVGTLYIHYDPSYEALGYVLLLIGAFMNQQAALTELKGTIEGQAAELTELNRSLERRVAEQVSEIDKLAGLRRFLAPAVADLVTSGGKEDLLNSHRGFIACIFCDIRNFTALSDSVEPEDVMGVLQDFHRDVGGLVSRRGGTIGFRSGDGFMAIVGDPLPVDDPSETALALATEMTEAFDGLRPRWRRLGYDIGVGVGVASGYATLGMIGDETRFDYTGIGNTINLAARLCDVAADGEVVVNRRVYADLEGKADLVPHGEVDLKGFDRPVEAFKLLRTPIDSEN